MVHACSSTTYPWSHYKIYRDIVYPFYQHYPCKMRFTLGPYVRCAALQPCTLLSRALLCGRLYGCPTRRCAALCSRLGEAVLRSGPVTVPAGAWEAHSHMR